MEKKLDLIQKYQSYINDQVNIIKSDYWPGDQRFSISALLNQLKARGFHDLSAPSFSRILKAEDTVSLALYKKYSQVLTSYIEDLEAQKIDSDESSPFEPRLTKRSNPGDELDQQVIFTSFPEQEIRRDIREANYEIILLQSYFSFLDLIQEELAAALRKGVKVRILSHAPNRQAQQRRSAELSLERSELLEKKSRDNIPILSRLKHEHQPNNLSIKLFKDQSSAINFIQIDQTIYQGYYWKHQSLTQGPFERRHVASHIGGELRAHFEALWNEVQEELDPATYTKPDRENKKQGNELSQISPRPSLQAFRCFYWHNHQVRQFILEITPTDAKNEALGYEASVNVCPSGTHYVGHLQPLAGEKKRTFLGTLLPEDGTPTFIQLSLTGKIDQALSLRQMIQGVILTQDLESAKLLASRLLLIRLDPGQAHKLLPTVEISASIHLPFPLIQKYLAKQVLEQNDLIETTFHFSQTYNNNLDERLILKDIHGTYELFYIRTSKQKLVKKWIRIDRNGDIVVWSKNRNWKLAGNIEVLNADHVLLRINNEVRGNNSLLIMTMKHSHAEPHVLKGTYTGHYLNDNQQAAPHGGRVLAIKADRSKLKGGITREEEELEWFDHDNQTKLSKKWSGFSNFFTGLNNLYLENSRSLISGDDWVKYYPSESLHKQVGKYEWYYRSSAEQDYGGIRKLALEIKVDGSVWLLDKFGEVLPGFVKRYGNHLLIHQYQTEPQWANFTPRPEKVDHNRPVHFQSLFSLYLDDSANPHLMVGIRLSYSRTREPMASKVVLIKNNSLDLQSVQPGMIPLTTDEEYERNHPHRQQGEVLKYLKSMRLQYLKTKKSPAKELKRIEENAEVALTYFWAAYRYGSIEQYSKAIAFITKAFQLGFPSQHPELLKAMENGEALFAISPQIRAIIG